MAFGLTLLHGVTAPGSTPNSCANTESVLSHPLAGRGFGRQSLAPSRITDASQRYTEVPDEPWQ